MKLPKGATLADASVKRAYQEAIDGNLDALKEIREAIEGKVSKAMVSVSLSLSELLAATENTGEVPTWLEGDVINLPAPELAAFGVRRLWCVCFLGRQCGRKRPLQQTKVGRLQRHPLRRQRSRAALVREASSVS